ncbi:SDR family oxidoreductase [Pollutimonas thiosulfatoxidans]|uniref:Short-chain dehydrogenase n=1 Tax=Pollutimonas thiosulfatoxidans TaxID=2028345 RepID=A0A410G8Z4_9BURK|nr:SDR family oxidoreductase [Pollutimonas thiosulfatoxidans]MBF6616617.1 SDR family oxidoreductase [Candidimonas sp.]NYT43421.1 SDR family oxidoreductase [Alcaligenaceae bacterium]QAA92746.1 short-chain dehydrogenase [Pollutimonas thiosulfatoxidans]
MKISLRPLDKQVIVITGASSGIGLATAREAARRGARLVLASRNRKALDALVDELESRGSRAVAVTADVGVQEDHQKIMDTAKTAFGGFDTWVNNAGVSIFGKLEDVAIEDQRQLFETNFWGVVYGSLTAVAHMRDTGGALINVGSEVSDRAIPLQGAYSASKHAVKGYTDSLRMELEAEGVPISVTLIKPASVNSRFVEHAKNYMDVEPQLPPPVYSPRAVAEAILYAAEHPIRDVFVGSASKLISALGQKLPAVSDRLFGRTMMQAQRSTRAAQSSRDALWDAGDGDVEHGNSPYRVHRRSLYTDMNTRWRALTWTAAGIATAVAVVHCLPKTKGRD